MLAEEDKQIFVDAGSQAARQILFISEEDLEDFLFPIWQQAIHEILIRHGCPCQRGDEKNCFLAQQPEVQERLFSDKHFLSFTSFQSLLEEAKQIFLESLFSGPLPKA